MTVPTRARSTPAQRLQWLPQHAEQTITLLDAGITPTNDMVRALLTVVRDDMPLLLELHRAAAHHDDRSLMSVLNRLEGEEP